MKFSERFPDPVFEDDWHKRAACVAVRPDELYPSSGHLQNRAILEICDGLKCAVKFSCLVDALERNDEHGIWGGLTERERRGLNRDRVLAVARGMAKIQKEQQITDNTNPVVKMNFPVTIQFGEAFEASLGLDPRPNEATEPTV